MIDQEKLNSLPDDLKVRVMVPDGEAELSTDSGTKFRVPHSKEVTVCTTTELKAAFAELERLRAMVNGQRYLIARLAPNCISCGLPKGSVCPAGYPGCGLADDMSLETPELKELADKWQALPQDAILFCPKCLTQHIDKAEPDNCENCGHHKANHYTGEPAEDPHEEGSACADCDMNGAFKKCTSFTAWLNPPHKKHRCHNCNEVFKPLHIPTNGVESL